MIKDQNERLMKLIQADPEQVAEIDAVLERRKNAELRRPSSGPLLLGMKASAVYLGVSRPTLFRMCRAKRLARVEIMPGCFRIRRADLDDLAASRGGREDA